VHLNWKGFVVDQPSAIALREHILVALSKAKGGTDWNDIIDAAVYGDATRKTRGSGFRMPWSYKRVKHNVCGGQGCSDCDKGKVDQLAYLPVFVYKPGPPLSAILQIGQEPTLEILEMAVVRTNVTQTIHVEPPSTRIKEGSFTTSQTKDEVRDDVLRGMIEEFVRTNMEGQSNAYIPKLFKKKDTYLAQTTSKYCENLRREHGSNHVWFIVSGQTILQKCFCLCETLRGRRDGFCKDFCGRRYQLPSVIVQRLYPEKGDIEKCPEIKTRVSKPPVKYGDVKKPLELFIKTYMNNSNDLQVLTITKKGNNFLALTNSKYCEMISGFHESSVMSYEIKKCSEIKQLCPICKKNTARIHRLTSNIIKILKQ
jgi:hypothetical protein